jgi:hypothetical protein
MKLKHFITHVNNIDLTLIAYNSIKDKEILKNNIYIIDNSEEKEITNHLDDFIGANVMYAIQPLTTAQSMNWIRDIAIKEDLDVVSWQHNDAEPLNDTVEKAYEIANNYIKSNKKFGVIFTNYDTFCIFSIQALKDTGKWDWIYFPFYYLDNDYYHRLEISGYEIVETNLKCKHHNWSSNTLKSDNARKIHHDITDDSSKKLYESKHGEYKPYEQRII